ncbi:hypothetical protein Pen02_24880 [Plantactinospora endophytica]|uniref:CsbD-like domain-containing protein n=2 Tax=Plantactinospora endophytica TaxID=673535 RepID=A0ABQ4DYP7_9ACTN|nr:hypothetical protein Pen02_24880 [Plantactinospora endophytica]
MGRQRQGGRAGTHDGERGPAAFARWLQAEVARLAVRRAEGPAGGAEGTEAGAESVAGPRAEAGVTCGDMTACRSDMTIRQVSSQARRASHVRGSRRERSHRGEECDMSAMDKMRNKAEELKGAAKERMGDRTDNEQMRGEGASEQMQAKAKQAGSNAKEAGRNVKETFDRR